MKLYFTTILFICLVPVIKVSAEDLPISPCPNIFQYRFNGHEWFGLVALRNSDAGQPLRIRVTLSMRGKPTTHYLGEIELLTRGDFSINAVMVYKIKFPKHHFPPKLLQITVDNQIVCFGSIDHSIFMTQIQLEHTRKVSYIADKKHTDFMLPALPFGGSEISAGKEIPMPAKNKFESKLLPNTQFKKKAFQSPMEICGNSNFNFQLPQRHQTQMTPSSRIVDMETRSFVKSTDLVDGLTDDTGRLPVFAPLSDADAEYVDENVMPDSINVGNNNDTAIFNLPTRGAWPWLAAIYVNNLTSLDYQCGGTLVSARVVISSAHCFEYFNQRYTANEVLVFLGRHNLKNWNEEGSLAASVDGIYIHSDYNRELSTYDADIAAILLRDKVRFNSFIRPVCLWTGSTKTEYIVGEHGIVIGWSFNMVQNSTDSMQTSETYSMPLPDTSIPKVIYAPIVSNEECFKAHSDFRSLSSNRTFCAAIQLLMKRNGHVKNITSFSRAKSESGISGAGLMILKNNRWMLRGTVSATLPVISAHTRAGATTSSSKTQYIIYSDVAKFIDWVTAFII